VFNVINVINMEHNQMYQVSYSLEKNEVEEQNPLKKTGGNLLRKALRVVEQINKTKLKNQMSKGNFVAILSVVILLFSACATQHPQKMKADFVGFSDEVSTSYGYTNKCIVKKWRKQSPPFDLISYDGIKNPDGIRKIQAAVDELRQGDQTSAYYALNNALNRVEHVQRKFMDKDPNSKYYVIMLSDGLDNKVADMDSYNSFLQKRMSTIMKKYCFFNLFKSKKPNTTNSFESYILLYKGKDMKESNYTDEQLKEKLTPFTGYQNASKDEDRTIIKEDINELVNILEEKLVSRSFSFRIPSGYTGKKVRMVLDTIKPVYFEGDFDGNYFKNIKTSDGFTIEIPDSKSLSGRFMGNGLTEFEVENLKLNGKPYKVNRRNVTQWFEDFGQLRYNSEYTTKERSHKNAYLIVLLDASKSFAEKYEEAKSAIMKIVSIVSEL
jgi:hypothetical protein